MAELHAEHSHSMGPESRRRALVREVRMPVPPMARRPCAVLGMCVAFVFLAATLDAYLWQHSMEREVLREELISSEIQNVELAAEVEALQRENIELRLLVGKRDLDESVHELDTQILHVKRRSLIPDLEGDTDPELKSPF